MNQILKHVTPVNMVNPIYSIIVRVWADGQYLVQLVLSDAKDGEAPVREFCMDNRLTMTMLVSELAESANPLLSMLEYEDCLRERGSLE